MIATGSLPVHARARYRGGAALLLAAALLAACSSSPATPTGAVKPMTVAWSSPGPSTVPSFYDPPSPLQPAAPGTLIREEKVTGVPGFPANATLWRILYHSRSISGADIAVSGYIAVPTAPAPSAGRPVITWAHGTTGVARICAPSLFSRASDASGIYLAPGLSQFIDAGYVVAATDYQGLGGPGVHPYLVGQAEGQNVLDAARAARHLSGAHASSRVVIVGHSQGGHAALFAVQLARTYAPDLHIAGTVAIAPLTETSKALPLAEQFGETDLLSMAGFAWSHTYTDLPMTSFFVAAAIPTIDKLMTTTCGNQIYTAMQSIPAAHVLAPGFASNPALVAHLHQNDPGMVHTDSPILIAQGTADTTVPDVLAETFEADQCPAVHDNLALRLYPGATHGTVLTSASHDIISWIHDRFAGTPVAPGCSSTTVTTGQ